MEVVFAHTPENVSGSDGAMPDIEDQQAVCPDIAGKEKEKMVDADTFNTSSPLIDHNYAQKPDIDLVSPSNSDGTGVPAHAKSSPLQTTHINAVSDSTSLLSKGR